MKIFVLIVAVLVLAETSFLFVVKLRQRTLKVSRGSLLLDTSAIMDGRIVEVAKTGIITAEIIIPRSVVAEMQLLADKADSDKRARARNGLDNVKKLREMENISVAIVQDGQTTTGVDDRLLELAQKYGAEIATTDYNLNKVAQTLDITVVNVNELAQSLRAVVLPGETTEIELVQPGANRDQGVGYLDDGTMVVVEDAKNLIGQKVKVEIVRSLQTEAGRMMFAKRAAVPREVLRGQLHTTPAFHSDSLHSSKTNREKKPRAKSRLDVKNIVRSKHQHLCFQNSFITKW